MRSKQLVCALFSLGLVAGSIACVGDDPGGASTPVTEGGSEASSGGLDSSVGDAPLDVAVKDTGTDAPVGFNPGTIPGLVVWLDAQDDATFTTGGGKITKWSDRSSAGNHATGVSAAEPSRVMNATLGKQVVHFVGPNQALAVADNASLYFHDEDDFVVAMVVNYTHAGGGGFLAKTNYPTNDKGILLFTISTGNFCFAIDGVCGEFPVSAATFHRYISRRTAAGLELRSYVDGNLSKTRNLGAVTDVSAPAHPLLIGANRLTAEGFVREGMTGDVAEVLVYHATTGAAAVTDKQIQDLDAYFKAKWGL